MKSKILFVVSLLFGLMFINAGLNKFLNYMPPPQDLPENLARMMKASMDITWLMPLVGIAEIVGGILFITNRFRALGALIIFPVMVGVLLTNITAAPSGLSIALPLFAILIWAIIDNKEKFMPLIRK
ncbi:DoxX family protein [Chitinophaga solisilvae]|uniref:DoxX family protein n=1 Tax=Chitinophaga solisilvae TaxID=1233460 RepID=A0A3S1CUP5_9BACT|nr:DoxX family protein [Chitinophaga solisilvae]NSL85762.1 DoxX family protein [Chitinophaga solisilvae]